MLRFKILVRLNFTADSAAPREARYRQNIYHIDTRNQSAGIKKFRAKRGTFCIDRYSADHRLTFTTNSQPRAKRGIDKHSLQII